MGLGTQIRPQIEKALDRDGELIDDDILGTIAARGKPTTVAADIRDRAGTISDRVCFYQPYAPSSETMAELVHELKNSGAEAIQPGCFHLGQSRCTPTFTSLPPLGDIGNRLSPAVAVSACAP